MPSCALRGRHKDNRPGLYRQFLLVVLCFVVEVQRFVVLPGFGLADCSLYDFVLFLQEHYLQYKDAGTYTLDLSEDLCSASGIESDIRKDDVVSGTLYLDTINNYIIRGDLTITEYSGEKGDANGDGSVDMGDVVLIMQSLANPNKYGVNGTDENHITNRGSALGDMNGGGLSTQDALSIQRILLGLDPNPAPYNTTA